MAQKEKLKSFIRQLASRLAAPDFRGSRLLAVVSPQDPVREPLPQNPLPFGI
jgi:hypothetical protein